MIDSVDLYKEILELPKTNDTKKQIKNMYLQIITTAFYELIMKKNSPLISEMCVVNQLNFVGENFNVEVATAPRLANVKNSFDTYYIFDGLNKIFSEGIDACDKFYESVKGKIFCGLYFDDNFLTELPPILKSIDVQLKNLSHKENKDTENILTTELKNFAANRTSDDEKIVDEIIKIQALMQNSLKQIAEIRDDIDFRTMKEPINQLIQLYEKLNETLKRHPQENGYDKLIKRCNSFLKYLIQSLKMLGVEIIDNTGETFNPNKNKISNDEKIFPNSIVTKINKVGFIYKGQVIAKAEVEIAQNSNGGVTNENRN